MSLPENRIDPIAREALARRLAMLPKAHWCDQKYHPTLPMGSPCPQCGRTLARWPSVRRTIVLDAEDVVERFRRLGFPLAAIVRADGTRGWQGSLGTGRTASLYIEAVTNEEIAQQWLHWQSARTVVIRDHYWFIGITDAWLAGSDSIRDSIARWAGDRSIRTPWVNGTVLDTCWPPPVWPDKEAWDEALELIGPTCLWWDGDDDHDRLRGVQDDVRVFIAVHEQALLHRALPASRSPQESMVRRL